MFEGFHVKVAYSSISTQDQLLTEEQLTIVREIMIKSVLPEKLFGRLVKEEEDNLGRKTLMAYYVDEEIACEIAMKIDAYLQNIDLKERIEVDSDAIKIYW